MLSTVKYFLRQFRAIMDVEVVFMVDAKFIRSLGSRLTNRLRTRIPIFVDRNITPSRVRFQRSITRVLTMFVVNRMDDERLGSFPIQLFGRRRSIFQRTSELRTVGLAREASFLRAIYTCASQFSRTANVRVAI